MNRARAKGTRGENFFLELLRPIFPTIDRAPLKGTLDAGDYVNVPYPFEAKSTEKPLFLNWVRRLKVIVARDGIPNRWVLMWKGDGRTLDGQPLMVLPLEFGIELLAEFHRPVICATHDGLPWSEEDDDACVHVQVMARG